MKRFLICVAILMIPALAFGQADTTGRVNLKVTDEEGKPVPQARVEIISSAMQGERVHTTDDRGRLLASLLPPGSYALTITSPGMETVNLTFRINIGQTVPLDVTLKKGDMTEMVTVYGTATPLETTTLGENFNYDTQVEEMPMQDRDIEVVASYGPNISFGPTPGTLAISGAPSFDTTVLLDGAEISDPYFGSAAPLFLEDAIEETQLLTSGVSARYGRFQGGVVNAVTKTGGNSFSGMLRAEFDKNSWNSQTPYNEGLTDQLNEMYQLTIGGFILKDHLWFFGGLRGSPSESASNTTIGTEESFFTVGDQQRYQLKLTGAITANHVVALSYLNSETERTNRAGLPAGDLFAVGNRLDPREMFTASYQGVLGDTMFVDFIYTKKDVSIRSGGDPSPKPGFPGGRSPFLDFYGSGYAIYNNAWWDYDDPSLRNNETFGINLTNVFSAGDWGDHTLEYGIQYVDSETGGLNNQSPTPYNLLNYQVLFGGADFSDCDTSTGDCTFNLESYYGPTGLSYRWEQLPFGTITQNVNNLGIYAQDTWQLNKWRFDIGFRFDKYDSSTTFDTLDLSFDNLAPRLGVTYNVDENWQVQATWGKYVSRFNDNVGSSVTGVSGAPYVSGIYTGPTANGQTYEEIETIIRDDANWDQIIVGINDPRQPTQFAADDLQSPYAYNWDFSVKRALPRNSGSITLTYTNRDYQNLISNFKGGNDSNPPDSLGYVVVDDPFGSPTQFTFDQTTWDNSSQANRQYQGLTLTVDYRPTAKWNVGGNWTHAWTRGNYEGEGRNTPSSGSIIGTYERSVNQAMAVPFGFLDEDVRDRGNAFGAYRFDWGRNGALALGGVLTYQSGRNWSKTGNLNYGDDPQGVYLNNQGSYTAWYDGRGANRFNGWWTFNVSARYQIPIYKRLDGWIKFNVVNVLNNSTLTSYQTSGGTNNDGDFPIWEPSGNPDAGDPGHDPNVPTATQCLGMTSRFCEGFGRIRNQGDYQQPRTFLVTIGLMF